MFDVTFSTWRNNLDQSCIECFSVMIVSDLIEVDQWFSLANKDAVHFAQPVLMVVQAKEAGIITMSLLSVLPSLSSPEA